MERTDYSNYDVVFIDNGRGANRDGIAFLLSHGHRVIERNEPFNWSRLNNVGASATSGELLLFLNDDIEITEPGWLTELVGHALRPDIGAVGALLTYPDGHIQHAGVVLVGHGGGAMHLLHRMEPGPDVYLGLQSVTREVTANTGACLMVSRRHFEEVGGFDEDLEVVGNDIDLCLRLRALGYRSIWTPYATLRHYESVSRSAISIIGDETKMWQRWSSALRAGDPHFNPRLVQYRPDCAIDWDQANARKPAAIDQGAGVNLIGYARAEMGLGEAMRGEAQAMTDVDIPFAIIDYRHGNPSRMGDDTFAHKVVAQPAYDVNLIYINADALEQALSKLPSHLRAGRYTIASWAWEMPEFPDQWLHAFGLIDEVWAPSEFVRQSVAPKAPCPVITVPYAVRVPPGPFLGREHFGLPTDAYQFLMMYDVHSVRERKNPRGALNAFLRAFGDSDRSVTLVIKINNSDDQERRAIDELVRDRANVVILDRAMSRTDVDSLLWCSDSYISLHRSEGFGLPIAEAMGLGKPVIATHWSGCVDFMTPDNAACVEYSLVTLDRDFGPYAAGQHWAEPDLDHAAWWMKRLRDDPAVGIELGGRASETIRTDFSPLRVGELTHRRLTDVQRRFDPAPRQ